VGEQAFMNKKESVHGKFEYTVEKENSKESVVGCGIVRSRITDNESSRQNEIRSHRNVDLEEDGEN